MNVFHPTSVQVQTEAKRSQSAGGVMTVSGQRSVRSQQLESNQPRKSVDEQFERTTKLVLKLMTHHKKKKHSSLEKKHVFK